MGVSRRGYAKMYDRHRPVSTENMSNELLRSLPSIERLLERPIASRLFAELGRDRVRDLLREITEELRADMANGRSPGGGSADLTQELERRRGPPPAGDAAAGRRRAGKGTGVS